MQHNKNIFACQKCFAKTELSGSTLTLQETRSIHDSMNIPKIEIHFLRYFSHSI